MVRFPQADRCDFRRTPSAGLHRRSV